MSKIYKGLAKAKEDRERPTINFFKDVPENPHKSTEPSELMLINRTCPEESEKAKKSLLPQEENEAGDVLNLTSQALPDSGLCRTVTPNPTVMLRNHCVALFRSDAEFDAYRDLCKKVLNRTWVTGGNLIMITSALPGEGKTVTAINLAFTFAREFKEDTLLVDCDFKNQTIHKLLGFRYEKGLVDYLSGDCPARDLFVSSGIEKLSLISGGKTVHEGTQLIDSPQMKDFVENMKGRYPEGYIFLDAPPILSNIEALNLIPLIDHVLIVVQAGRTSTAQVSKAAQLIPKQELLGLILNRFRG